MELDVTRPVTGSEGWRGQIEETLPGQSGEASQVRLRLENGQTVVVPESALRAQPDGSYYLPVSLAEMEQTHARPASATEPVLTIPVIAEELQIGKRQVETGRTRITKTVREHTETIDEPLMREEVAIEHVPINKVWDGPAPPVRYEGETLVIPLLEEVLVVEKRLLLKEELRIRKRQTTVHEPQEVTLRSEEIGIQKVEPAPAAQEAQTT